MQRDGAESTDVVVIGGGFGGLACALQLAEAGVRVTMLERVGYVGGCAGTFVRRGARYEAGATLAAGLGPNQLFGRWIAQHGLDVPVAPLDPVVSLRGRAGVLDVHADRARLVQTLADAAGPKAEAVRAFFALQQQVADALWPLLDDPELLPPLGPRSLWTHLLRTPAYLPLLPLLGQTLHDVLVDLGVDDQPLLLQLCASTCQITVQCPPQEAEALWALATLDYWFRGAAHVVGGMGRLATALATAITQLGGTVLLQTPALALQPTANGWEVQTRKGTIVAHAVVANLLPGALAGLLPAGLRPPRLARDQAAVDDGWSAMMLYLQLRAPPAAGEAAHHVDVTDGTGQLTLGHHVFLSVSALQDTKASDGLRTAIVSTHVPLALWRSLDAAGQAALAQEVTDRMRQTLRDGAPEWMAGVVHEMTASPRTWQRFTGRPGGAVGGVPRRAGLHNYLNLWPKPLLPGLWMTGDSQFPGQSALGVALGGCRVAALVRQSLPAKGRRAA